MFMIGVSTACVAALIDLGINAIASVKYLWITNGMILQLNYMVN